MFHSLVLTERLHKELQTHLYPGDGLETVAIMLCHYGQGRLGFRLIVNDLIPIPSKECTARTDTYISWPFADYLPPDRISEIDRMGLSIITVHSHPTGSDKFSLIDDHNDRELFHSVCNWFDDERPHGSAIMLPSGKIISRIVGRDGKFTRIKSVSVLGDSIQIWKHGRTSESKDEYGIRIAQTFGKGTFDLLRKMRVGVVGCSGTGSIIVELLTRNCIGYLVIVDPDRVEEKNLNRLVNARKIDARKNVPKVEPLKRAIRNMGMRVRVDAYNADTKNSEVIEALTDCDVIFGCVDSASGRYHLECIASAYFIPYFDIGVNLESDRRGGISQADAVAHYRHPGNASLMSRGAYTMQQVTAEGWQKADKKYYKEQRLAGYLAEVGEDQPAVMSINMQAACMAFNDFLARVHGFRLDPDADYDVQRFRFVHGHYINERAGKELTSFFRKYSGLGERSYLVKSLKSGLQ